jgi:hypothetical protein
LAVDGKLARIAIARHGDGTETAARGAVKHSVISICV